MSNRRNRGRNRSNNSSPQKSSQQQSPPQPPQDEAMPGWSMKKSRIAKRNARKPDKPDKPKQQSPNPNKKNKAGRNARRRRNRRNKLNQLNNAESNDPNSIQSSPAPQINNIVNDIIESIEYDGDRKVIIQVVQQLNLKSFDPNNDKLQVRILNTIQNIKTQQAMAELNVDGDQDQDQNQQDQNHDQPQNMDDEEEEEEDDHEDEDEENEYEDDQEYEEDGQYEEDDHEDDDDEENEYEEDQDPEHEDEDDDDQKTSSEEQQRIDDNESEAVDDDKKEEEVQDLEQRKKPKKRKRKRNRNKNKNRDKQQNDDEDDNEQSQDIIDNDDQESTPKQPIKQTKAKRERKKKKKVKDLDLRNLNGSIQQLKQWRDQLQREITNKMASQQFLNSFMKQDGIVVIAEKIVLSLGDINFNNRQDFNAFTLRDLIISLFDLMLSGTHDYHEWLFGRLCQLAQEIKKLSSDNNSNTKNKNNNNKQLIDTICEETRNLISAQSLNLLNRRNDIVFRKDNFNEPSELLDDGHTDKDPIVPMLEGLDNECSLIADYFHELRKHDNQVRSTCPTSSESFNTEYNMITTHLETKVSSIQAQSNRCCDRLASAQAQKQELQRRQEDALRPLKEQLRGRRSERYQLLQEEQRLQQQLELVKQNLIEVDMLIDDSNKEINKITEEYQPQENRLTQQSTNYQFEIAGYQQQSGCYNTLLQIVNESHSKLHSWSSNRLQRDNTDRNELENNYVNSLARYLIKLCEAKMEIENRVRHLQAGIEQFRKTNEISNQKYGQSRNIDNDLRNYQQNITIDRNTNKNIEQDMFAHIDRAQKIVTPSFFGNFIDHLINKSDVGKVIKLDKYRRNNNTSQQQRRSPPRTSTRRPVRSSQSTQTQMNGSGGVHPNDMNMNQTQSSQQRTNPNAPRPRKGPLTKSSQPQQSQQQQRAKPPMRYQQNQNQNQNQNNYNQNRKRPLSNNMNNNQQFQQY